MKKTILIVLAMVASLAANAQRIADFASKYMDANKGDSLLKCVTVGPRMMEQLTKMHDTQSNEAITQAIKKLKTARIVTVTESVDSYYEKAEKLLKQFPRRFSHDKDFRNAHSYGTFYTRRQKDGAVVELIMLHADTLKPAMVIVNLTGDIDNDFIELLSKNVGSRK